MVGFSDSRPTFPRLVEEMLLGNLDRHHTHYSLIIPINQSDFSYRRGI